MLVKKDVETKLFKLIAYKEGRVEYEFNLDKKKLLVGSAENCDIRITDSHISHYHALLMVDEHGCKVIDLESNNGVWINGEKERNFYFSTGDSIKFGPIEFHVEELLTSIQKGEDVLHDQDQSINTLQESTIADKISELPPVDGLVVIDGEYCDIEFDEATFTPVDHIPAIAPTHISSDYVDTEEEKEHAPIARESEQLAIEVTVLSNGVTISVDYFPMNDGLYNVSPTNASKNMIHLPCLDAEDNLPFFQVSNGQVEFFPINGFDAHNTTNGNKLFNGSDKSELTNNETISYNYKTVQVVARITKAPANLRFAPFFGRDRNFQMQAAKVFSGLMSLMLLLLLVDIE
ncbi:MAG: FHA domain-containing protein, partial [Bacteriovoracaceae bacterium]|nr:FHA domain-containing protein [Bacteriovoracaceae bacterium]